MFFEAVLDLWCPLDQVPLWKSFSTCCFEMAFLCTAPLIFPDFLSSLTNASKILFASVKAGSADDRELFGVWMHAKIPVNGCTNCLQGRRLVKLTILFSCGCIKTFEASIEFLFIHFFDWCNTKFVPRSQKPV